jgi:hypothetical protein
LCGSVYLGCLLRTRKQQRKIDREWKEVNEMVIRICEVRMGGKSYFIVDLCYLFANNLKLEMKTILE